MRFNSSSKVSPRCLSLLASVALWDREKLVAVAYALKNDPHLTAVQLARRWAALPSAQLEEVALKVLGKLDDKDKRARR